MCLAIPGQVKEIKGQQVMIQYPGEVRKALLGGEDVKIGDYVLVQMGIVIKTITSEEAKVSLEAWEGE